MPIDLGVSNTQLRNAEKGLSRLIARKADDAIQDVRKCGEAIQDYFRLRNSYLSYGQTPLSHTVTSSTIGSRTAILGVFVALRSSRSLANPATASSPARENADQSWRLASPLTTS
jgi:hypothetical protein